MNWPFENDTGAVIRKIASSRLKHDKLKRSISIFAISLAAMLMSAGIGDTISIFMPDTQEQTVFRISGYLETAAAGTDRTLYAAVVSEQYYREQNGWTTFPPSVLIRVNTGAAASRAELEERIAEIMKKAGIESTPSMNEAYINLSKPSALLVGTAIAGLAVITAAGVLVIYCIFYIAIINSIKEYGQLRTIGMTGRQIKRLVFREGFSLSVTAVPVGLVAGTILSYRLVPQGFQPVSLLWIWPLVAVLVYITVRFSIRKPAMIAAAVSPVEACRYSGSRAGTAKRIIHPQRISPVMLAKKHLADNMKKHALTITSLTLTGILLIGLSSVLSSISAEEMSRSGFQRGQFIIQIRDEVLRNNSLEQMQTVNPFTKDLKDSLSGITGMEAITEYHYLPVSAEPGAEESDAAVVGFGREDMDLLQSCTAEGMLPEYDILTANDQIIIGRPDDLEKDLHIQAKTGQTITLKVFDGTAGYHRTFEIGAVLDQSKIGNHGDKIDMLMLPLDAMNDLASCDTTWQYTVRVSDGAEAQAEREIEQMLQNIPELSMTSLSAAVAQNENFIQGMKTVLMTAAAFIGCFAVMNLVNTILTGIITRQKEFALMRSVGMSRKQLSVMVRCESLITVMTGSLLSLIMGGAIGNILCSFLKKRLMSYLTYQFPIGIAVLYCVCVVCGTLVITGAALGYQNRASLIEQLHR